MSTHSFSVSGEPEAYLNQMVNAGYSKSSVLQDALRLKMEQEIEASDRLERIEGEIGEIRKMLGQVLETLEILKGRGPG